MARSINVQKIQEEIILTVQAASFAEAATVLFMGTRGEALIFAIKNALDAEDYTVVAARDFVNDPDSLVTVTELLPSGGEGQITPDELALIQKVTGSYRHGWSDRAILTVEAMADATDLELFVGDRQTILVYLLTTVMEDGDKFAIAEYNPTAQYGATLTKLLSTTGPNLVTQAQVDLVRIFVQ